jgi:peptide/nickel transport system substrate-binding protein
MLRNRFMLVIGVLVVASMILSACGGGEVVETPDVVVTEAPTAAPVTRTGAWVDQIVFTGIEQGEAAVTQLQAGSIDIYAYSVSDAVLFETVKADPNLTYSTAFGSFSELTFNPGGPVSTDGRLNPFAIAKIREAMNLVVDRDYMAQEIYGGLGIPKYTNLNANFPDYARYVDVAAAIEAKYAYNFEGGKAIIDAEMEALGAEMVDGKWNYDGVPVVLIGIIRVEDERQQVGDYFGSVLEDLGFTVDYQYKTSPEAAPIWQKSDPDAVEWHWYTGGWITTSVSRDDASDYGFFFTNLYLPWPLFQYYAPPQEFFDVALALWNSEFSTMEERGDLFRQALPMAAECSYRIVLIDQQGFTPQVANLQVTYDLAGGVAGADIYPYTIRYAGEEGGVVRWAQPSMLVDPWNPIGGSNWVYDQTPENATTDWGTMYNPYTGLKMPQRIESGAIEVIEGLPIGQTLDWVTLDFVSEITVPADAWADWDATTQTFIPVGEGVTALIKSTVTYPSDLWTTVTWHDGSPITMGDFIMGMILTFDPAKTESLIYDEAQVSNFDAFMSIFKGVKIVSVDPLVIETYQDYFGLDAENQVVTWYPNYNYGTGAWHNLALGIQAEIDAQLAFSADKAEALEVEWMNFIGGPSLDILAGYLETFVATPFIPYEPTMGMYVTADEAATRYTNLQAWYDTRHHFWIGTGPFYLEAVFPVEGTITLTRYEAYPDPSDKWSGFATPKVAVVDLTGPASVAAGEDATFDVFVTFEDAPYPAAELGTVLYLVYDATNTLVEKGEATMIADGQYQIVVDTTGFEAGSNKVKVVVTSLLVSIPTIQDYEFVTTAP